MEGHCTRACTPCDASPLSAPHGPLTAAAVTATATAVGRVGGKRGPWHTHVCMRRSRA